MERLADESVTNIKTGVVTTESIYQCGPLVKSSIESVFVSSLNQNGIYPCEGEDQVCGVTILPDGGVWFVKFNFHDGRSLTDLEMASFETLVRALF